MKIVVATTLGALAATVVVCSIPASADTNCAAFPDASCTGPIGPLTPYSGPMEFRTNGQVIENVEIQSSTGIDLSASNVTFRNVRFIYTGPLDDTWAMINNEGRDNVFDHVEMDGRSNVARAIDGNGLTVRNSNIHHVGNGLEIEGPMLVEDNYIHDIKTTPGTNWHADGIQTGNSGTENDNITIRHNTVILTGDETGAIFIEGTPGNTATNVLIENNLFAGGSYTMYTGYGENYRVINNHFSTRIFPKVGRWGIWYPPSRGLFGRAM